MAEPLPADLRLEIDRARIENLLRHRVVMWLANLVMMGFAAFVVRDHQPHAALAAWWAANLLFGAWRMRDQLPLAAARRLSPAAARAWLRRFTFSAGADGVLWGIGGLCFLTTENYAVLVVFLLTLSGVANGSVGTLASCYPAIVAFAAPMTILTALGLYCLDIPHAGLFAVLTLALLAFILAVGRNYARVVNAIVTRDLENLRLLRQVTLEKERAEKTNRDKSRFLAAVSHDLRQPLYAMGLYLEALGDRLSGAEAESLHRQVGAAHRVLDELFTELLEISRLDAAEVEAHPAHVAVAGVLDGLVSEFQAQADERGLELSYAVSPAVVYTDPVLLSRIVRNLLSNAFKFTTHGGVSLDVEETSQGIVIVVSDSGCGIAPEHHEAIFAEYYQVANPARSRQHGLGLGLAVVTRLAKLTGIAVSFESRVDEGTRFRLVVPRGDPARAVDLATSEPMAADIRGLHVLVIDDDPAIRDGLDIVLAEQGCVVSSGADLAEALAAAGAVERPVDMLLCDYRLGDDRDGVAAVTAARAALDASLPAILVTGDTDPQTRRAAEQAGIPLLRKPVRPALLAAAIAAAV
ncbi:MAG: ATP-binding protein [Gammaproteobacteria bacterium]